MSWYQIANNWQHFAAMVKEEWDKLTGDDLTTFGVQMPSLPTSASENMARRGTGATRNHRVFT